MGKRRETVEIYFKNPDAITWIYGQVGEAVVAKLMANGMTEDAAWESPERRAAVDECSKLFEHSDYGCIEVWVARDGKPRCRFVPAGTTAHRKV